MPTIREDELQDWENSFSPCVVCNESAGDIWLCGEGFVCTACFSEAAGIEEERVFEDELPDEYYSQAKIGLRKLRDAKDEG